MLDIILVMVDPPCLAIKRNGWHVSPLPFQEHGLGQEIPVQDQQGPADVLCGTEAIMQHLYHMGNGLIPEPVTDGTIPSWIWMDSGRQKIFT